MVGSAFVPRAPLCVECGRKGVSFLFSISLVILEVFSPLRAPPRALLFFIRKKMASENNLTFTFSGGEGTPPARISIARAHLNKKSFASSMLTTLAAERWQGESKETSFDVSTAESLEASWSAACADVIQQIYESFPEEICEDSPAYVFELPAEVDFEEMLNVLDYFGLQHEFDRLLQASKLQINVKDGNLASQIRAKLFLNNRYYVYEASSYVKNQVMENPRSKSRFIAISSNDSINYINRSQTEPLKPICNSTLNQHYEWAASETHRNHFAELMENEGLETKWSSQVVELSGARGKCDYLDYDYDTIEARRWIAEIKIPARSRTAS